MEKITMHGRFEGDGDVGGFYLALAHQDSSWLVTNVKVKYKGKGLRLEVTAKFEVWYCGLPEDYIDIKVFMREFLMNLQEEWEKCGDGHCCAVFAQSCKPYIKGDPSLGERSNYFFPEYV